MPAPRRSSVRRRARGRRSSPTCPTTGPPRSGSWSARTRWSSTTAISRPASSPRRGVADMSSLREAPEMAKDPVADSTDVYAFVSPDRPDTVTLIANYIPFQAPAGGPNFYEFGDDVIYDIHISNQGRATHDITYRFHFHTEVRNSKTFLYNTGPITSIASTSWNRPQFYSLTRIKNGTSKVLASKLACPPVNVGPRSPPNYSDLAAQAVHKVGKRRVFAGQRAAAFPVDLGSVFDLGT